MEVKGVKIYLNVNLLPPRAPTMQETNSLDWDFGMDQYVSWGLTKVELELETIWSWFEEFCKPQSNEVHARFDLLTSFCQGSKSADEWYNCVQAQINLAKYPPETAKILHRTSSGFTCMMKNLCPRPLMKAV